MVKDSKNWPDVWRKSENIFSSFQASLDFCPLTVYSQKASRPSKPGLISTVSVNARRYSMIIRYSIYDSTLIFAKTWLQISTETWLKNFDPCCQLFRISFHFRTQKVLSAQNVHKFDPCCLSSKNSHFQCLLSFRLQRCSTQSTLSIHVSVNHSILRRCSPLE